MKPTISITIIGSSETPRVVCSEKISNSDTSSKRLTTVQFSYWLAGLIDGDGTLLVSKKKYASCEITVGIKEFLLLSLVKERLGGSIKKRSGAAAYRWRLHNAKGVNKLLSLVDGKLLIEKRQEQYLAVCAALKRTPVEPPQCAPKGGVSRRHAWITGFYEAEGFFNVNRATLQCTITLSRKERTILENIRRVMGGNVYYDKSWDGWLYSAASLTSISHWVSYFSSYPLRSWKQTQLKRFKRVLLYKSRGVHLRGPVAGRSWKRFQQLLNEFHAKHKAQNNHHGKAQETTP